MLTRSSSAEDSVDSRGGQWVLHKGSLRTWQHELPYLALSHEEGKGGKIVCFSGDGLAPYLLWIPGLRI